MTAREHAAAVFGPVPGLRVDLPRRPIVAGPTPVERLEALEGEVRSPVSLWVKRDDLSARPYGGNKPRKLEFLLGDCIARGSDRIVTVGGIGSNHCLATALYARDAGVAVEVCLVDQPLTDTVRATLGAMVSAGARVHWAESGRRAPWTVAGLLVRRALAVGQPRPTFVGPGGSTPLGTVGIVAAAFELVGQIERREAPEPAAIFLALGSAGTHAGLVAGLRLAGLRVPVVGVAVSDLVRLDARTVARLANRTLRLLSRAGSPAGRGGIEPREVLVATGFLGDGYGYPTPEGEAAIRLLDGTEGLRLDETYTAKAMAAMLAAARERRFDGPLLFWHSYNAHPLPAPDPGWEARLPAGLRERLESGR